MIYLVSLEYVYRGQNNAVVQKVRKAKPYRATSCSKDI